MTNANANQEKLKANTNVILPDLPFAVGDMVKVKGAPVGKVKSISHEYDVSETYRETDCPMTNSGDICNWIREVDGNFRIDIDWISDEMRSMTWKALDCEGTEVTPDGWVWIGFEGEEFIKESNVASHDVIASVQCFLSNPFIALVA